MKNYVTNKRRGKESGNREKVGEIVGGCGDSESTGVC